MSLVKLARPMRSFTNQELLTKGLATVETALSAFLSHSNLDESQVKLVQRFLTEIGIKPWVSFDDIHNSDYDKLIARQIKSKNIFLLILSNNSANSKNVQNECAFADANNKIIVIYELETTDIPEGLALRLGRKQRILAYKFSDDSLERLARLIIQESGLDWLAYSTKARDAESKIKRQQLKIEQQYQRNLDNYKEDYWNCRTRNGKCRADAEIVVIERERLSSKKVDFCLTDTAISKIQAEFDRRRKRPFTVVLSNTLAMKMLTLEDLQTLERKRLDCCVSKNEVADIIASRKNIPPLQLESGSSLQIDQPLMIPIDITWIKDLFEQRREELYKTKTTVSKDKTKTSVPRCRKVDDPLNAVASKTDSTILEQDDIYKASMDSNLDSGASPSKHRLRRFFNCNEQFLIVSEVFLGNEIKSIDVTHIERNDNSIAFSGKRIPGVTYGQYGDEIRATRKFREIIISDYTIKFIQDGFNNYLIASVEPERDNYRRLVTFLEGLGIPVSNVGSLPKQAAMPKSSEAVADDLTALSEFKETLKQYLHINPDPANNKQTLKALQAHKLTEQYIGKVLVHFNTSILRGKNGIIIFEKGFLMSDLFCEEHLFYFGIPEKSNQPGTFI